MAKKQYCPRCKTESSQLDRLIVNYDDALNEREPLRRDLCRRCVSALEMWLRTPRETALDRLKANAPQGPPFVGLMLDRPTVEYLASGQCNARAEVAAREALAEL